MTANDSPDTTPGAGARRRPGQLEAQVVTVLVDAGRPLTPGEVRERLDPSLALSYSTVVTTLSRLYEKDAVSRHRAGRAYRYAAVADAATLVAKRMRHLLAAEPDHASVLRRFVSSLDPDDERTLRDLLDSAADD
ncbi:BlaI/MecI/CopY family transcriptional regulator [Phytohabitans kaempferiae]|uniref:BlaI/MecI/CopY family transcriptional regulator n=1 Tax=Phytohabitans kaempferiae TaxID=1620943 RepID=A0ABV6MB90_9ACTN